MKSIHHIEELRSRVQDRTSLYMRNAEGHASMDPLKVEMLLDDVNVALREHGDLIMENAELRGKLHLDTKTPVGT